MKSCVVSPDGTSQLQSKLERLLRIHVADAVHQLQPRFAIEGLCLYAELAEVVQQIQFDAFQTGLGGFVGIRFNP